VKNTTPVHPIPTREEKLLADYLRAYGWPLEIEHYDGFKHVDIAILERRVYIEVDGQHHCSDPVQALADLKRAYYSFKNGFVTLRIPNALVRDDATIEQTASFINEFLRENGEPSI
jgi:very-short-patch-repair endonuclease